MFILQIKFGEPVQRQTIYPNTHFTYIKFLIANTTSSVQMHLQMQSLVLIERLRAIGSHITVT